MAFNLRRAEQLPDTGQVRVACRMPNGLRLELPDPNTPPFIHPTHPRPGGEIPFATLRGWSLEWRMHHPDVLSEEGVGLTWVDAQKFKRWWELMAAAKYPPVMNGMVFALAKDEDAKAKAREEREIRSGLDPINPDAPGRGVEMLKGEE